MQMTLTSSPEENLAALGLSLPQLPAPGGNYVSAKRVGAVVYLSGVISTGPDGIITGTAGDRSHYRRGLRFSRPPPARSRNWLFSNGNSAPLTRVIEVVTVNGYVNAAPGFVDSPAVINGASDLLVRVFGDAGRHVRAAVGVSALPRNALVELQMTVRVAEL